MIYKPVEDTIYGTQAERTVALAIKYPGTYYVTLDGDRKVFISDGAAWQPIGTLGA